MLANYRAAKIRDQTESVASQLSREMDQLQTTFEGFLAEAKDGPDGAFKDFLVDGLDELKGSQAIANGAALGATAGVAGGPVGVALRTYASLTAQAV